MLSLYYVAPTNTVKLQLMKDMMGLMYNDINNDDAVKRILAPISGAVVVKNEQLKSVRANTAIEKLLAARDLRRFMEQQLEVAKKILNEVVVAQDRDALNDETVLERKRICSRRYFI
ncbi:MAG: hypothetical protein KDD37_10565 [Bdellovibrionales bacterium]|nr:hypothetical protein [Bdellovibrionales bacterium]